MDLFDRLEPACAECVQFDPKPITAGGVHYCWGEMTWRGPDERVAGCVYRDRPKIAHPLRKDAA